MPKINSSAATKLRRDTLNYLFQFYALINNISVYDNLKIAMEYVNCSNKEKEYKIKAVLKKLHLSHAENHIVNILSGGEQQRVAMARCILKPGDLILADEPTGSLDGDLAQIVIQEILNLRNDYHKIVIFVTYDMNLSKQADMVIKLNE